MSEIINENLLIGVEVGQKTILGPKLSEIGASLQTFGIVDYVVFIFMLSICLLIGVYFGFFNASKSIEQYLMGGRKMKTIPISLSLISSYISGITLLGIPTEIYLYGIQYLYVNFGILLMAFLKCYIYLPVFYKMNLTSIYEYLENRFDKKVRLFGSVLYVIGLILWLPVVIYIPALAFNQISGANIHLMTPVICTICIFYTCVGGLRAVVWTDVLQGFLMYAAIIIVSIKGTIDAGGLGTVLEKNWITDRIEGPNFNLDPFDRHTVWALVIGGAIYWLQTACLHQNMIQRYLSLADIKSAKKALWIFIIGAILINILCGFIGLVIYATYSNCDPITTKLAKQKDQLLPLLVMQLFGKLPGFPGLFVAGIFSAALSSLSTALNSLSAVILQDFVLLFTKSITQKTANRIMKSTVILVGILSLVLVFVVEKLKTVLQFTMSLNAIVTGPTLGLFNMGLLLPWINSHGAFYGGFFSLAIMFWLSLNAQIAISKGQLRFDEKNVSTNGCTYQFSSLNATNTEILHTDEIFMIYKLSYLWYTLVGATIAMVIGIIVTYYTDHNWKKPVDPNLFAPMLKNFIEKRNSKLRAQKISTTIELKSF